jgi:16S rRNA processing protein RimM
MPFLPPQSVLPWPDDAVEVGRVLGAWGVKGAFRVQPFAADPQALFASKAWFLKPAETPAGPVPAAARAAVVLPATLRVAQVREQGDGIVATAHEVPDRDAAELLKGARIFVPRAAFPAASADEFYWVDLIGCAVSNREGVALGTVVGLIETGPHCVLRVQPPESGAAAALPAGDATERLIPFVDAFVDTVDLPGRRLVVDWGLDF